METLLNKLFGAAELGRHLRLSAGEVTQIKEFIIQLTAQNSELALRLAELTGEAKRPQIQTEWTPFD